MNFLRFHDVGLLLRTVASNIGFMAPLLLAVAVALGYAASVSVRNATAAAAVAKSAAPNATVSLRREPLTPDQSLAAARHVAALAPAVKVAMQGSAVVVSIDTPALFGDWLHAINALQSSQPAVMWDAEQVCLAQCGTGITAIAIVKGFRQRLVSTL